MPEVDEITPEAMDNYIGAEIMISHGDTVDQGSVRHRNRNVEGYTTGGANSNPILDNRTYEVEFEDGSMSNYSANVITEIVYAQCDEEGQKHLLFGSILYHKTDGHALLFAEQDVVVRGQSSKLKTMKGWHFCVQWKDGTTTWERLSEFKEYHPIQVAEHSLAQGIRHDPEFNLWSTHVLKKRESIITALKGTTSQVIKKISSLVFKYHKQLTWQ